LNEKPEQSAQKKYCPSISILLAAGIILLSGMAAGGYYFYFSSGLGPAQPIPFSHRFHVTEKKLSCFFCHDGAMRGERAGVPPLETCMLCHSKIIIHYPQIERLRRYYDQRQPVAWARVTTIVPEFVYFNHEVHVRAGFDCSQCHGDVAAMDRLSPLQTINMGFCVQCHRDNDFSHDCLRCHR
jgi:hypothetical protein